MSDEDNKTPDKEHGSSDDKRSRFEHLGKTSNVISTKRGRGLFGFLVGLLVLLLIFFFMFSGGKHHKEEKNKPSQMASNDEMVLQQNMRRLTKLREEAQQPVVIPRFHTPNVMVDSKAMKARRNAPTQMFNAQMNAVQSSSGNTRNANNRVFAGEGAFSKFANSQSNSASTVSGSRIKHPYFTIAEGEFIHAALETAINSDLPGMVRAVITEPVYAYLGEKILIPAGSRLIGQYTSTGSNGAASNRVFVIWNRVITPRGVSIMINSPGTDALGRSGEGADSVDTHFWKIFGTASLLSVMGAVSATSGVGNYDQPNSANMYRQSIASAFQQSAQTTLGKNLNIKPTLYIHQGNSINVFVAHDLDLYSVLGQAS